MPRPRDPAYFQCTRHLESQAMRQGCRFIAGCDEAGRGALLGPLYAAAVILDPAQSIPGIDDSKKLAPRRREELANEIRAKALAWQVVAITAVEVDELNVYEASRQGMLRALKGLIPAPDYVLTDAMPLRYAGEAYSIPHRAIIHGDARSVSIAAASILAKVARDEHLRKLDGVFPQYGLAKNKGYGTQDHLTALSRFGPCPEHRKTYRPVKDCLLPLFPWASPA
ncbi:MAG TPA: ribonuclease HII [Terriglobia bacterium]|nr:ribonuclease HII [Terriglobia bacterium]